MRKKKWSKKISNSNRKDFYGEYINHGIKDFLGYSFEQYVQHFYLIPKQK
jgi:hypothetical protein